MREIRLSGSEGGVALTTPSLPLSHAGSPLSPLPSADGTLPSPDSHLLPARATGGRGCISPSHRMSCARTTQDRPPYGVRWSVPPPSQRPADGVIPAWPFHPSLAVAGWKAASPFRSTTALQRTPPRYRDSPSACSTTGVSTGSVSFRSNTPFNFRPDLHHLSINLFLAVHTKNRGHRAAGRLPVHTTASGRTRAESPTLKRRGVCGPRSKRWASPR